MKAIAATVLGSRRDFFWLDSNYAMNTQSPVRGGGFNLNFGGIFTSAPAAVMINAHRPPVLDPGASSSDAPGAGLVGGPGGSGGPFGLLTPRLDLFGLGLDYALYHKRFWGAFDQNDFQTPWQKLDGIFTSAPAAIDWGNERVDVFGLGLDHAMYQKTAIGNGAWSTQWARLGGTFTSAASLIVVRNQLQLFARGNDFTCRGNHSDGTTWFGFQNHGGNLASPPVAVSWGPDRIDLFAIFNDGALWHRWWDGQIWNEWESLGGKYAGEPAAVSWAPGRLDVFVMGSDDRALHHHWFSGDTWSVPEVLNIGLNPGDGLGESPTAISLAPNQIEVFFPSLHNQIRSVTWNGSAWSPRSEGANIRCPQRYSFSVDEVIVRTTRSALTDTDGAVSSVSAGNAPVQTAVQWIGDTGGPHPSQNQTNLLVFSPVTVDLAEPMSFSYTVVNNGHAAQDKILAALKSGSNALALAGSSSMQEDIGKGVAKIVTVALEGAIKVDVPVVGSVLAAIESWLLGKLTDVIFADCDGLVAVEMRAMIGRDLHILTNSGRTKFSTTTTHHGTDSAAGCFGNSVYDVLWSITPL
jgi:hypothetical protein